MLKPWDQPPHITYKHLLDKGEELTTGEVVYLLNKEVYAGKIAKATNMTIQEVRAIKNKSDRYIQNHKKVVMEMGKFNLTQAEYNDHKAKGMSDDDIAKLAGVSNGTLGYHKKKWLKEEVRPRTPKLILAENESSPSVHEDLVHDLSSKLRKAEKRNSLLEEKVAELEEQIKNLHAAAEDTEKEVAASQEYVQREQELMEDANVWKQQALQYKAENERLNKCLEEERQEKNHYKGVYALSTGLLKAVL